MRLATFAVIAVASLGCAPSRARTPTGLGDLRSVARASPDAEIAGRWALAEAFAPGGTAAQAAAARARLDTLSAASGAKPGMWASLARAVLDDAHGVPASAARAYASTLVAAADDPEPETPLVAWFAARHLMDLRGSVTQLFAQNRAAIESLLARPGHLGWRTVAELEDWRAAEVYATAERTQHAYDDEVIQRMGCARDVRIAGPFGHGTPADARRSFPAEAPTPWPASWPADSVRGTVPRVLAVKQTRCLAAADEQVKGGVFYVESFFTTRGDREIIVAVQGAVTLWIDGAKVLSRSTSAWGSWQRFGAHVAVGSGRHRIVAKTQSPLSSVRILNPDGTAAGVETDGFPAPPTTMVPPRLLSDPNPIEGIVRAAAVGDTAFAAIPVDAILAAYAAHVDRMDDVASTLMAPLVLPRDSAPLALALASSFVGGDP
ncbi:MAG: hypothetical protein ACREJ3_12960, partial [Polyangiaceae bacterium]